MQMKSKIIIIIIIAIFIPLLGMSGYVAWWAATESQSAVDAAVSANTNSIAINTGTNANPASAAADGYVALEDITMDTSKWVTYRNEELGVELKVPGELYDRAAWQNPGYYVAMISNSEQVLSFFVEGKTNQKPPTINFFIELSRNEKSDYTTGQFLDMGVTRYEGSALPLVDSRYDILNGRRHYRELRIWTIEQQKEYFQSDSVGPLRIRIEHRLLSDGKIYFFSSQIDAYDYQRVIDLIDAIIKTATFN